MGKQSLIFMLAGLVLGGLAGFFMGAMTASGPERRVMPDLSAVQPPGDDTASITQRQPEADRVARAESPHVIEQPVVTDEPARQAGQLEAWLGDVSIPELPTGDGKIWGVARCNGEPLAGVTVRAHARQVARESHPGGDAPLEEVLRFHAREELRRRQNVVEAITGPDGRYELTGLIDTDYSLGASMTGYRLVSSQLHGLRPGTEVSLEFSVAGTLALDVRMPDGSPAPSARLHLRGESQSWMRTWSRANVPMVLAPGSYFVELSHEEYESGRIRVEVRAGELTEQTINLLKTASVTCRVEFTEERARRGAMARVHLVSDPPPEPPLQVLGSGEEAHAHLDAKFSPLEPGRYRFVLVINGEIHDWKDVDVTDGPVRVTLSERVDPPEERKPEDHIPVRVILPEGTSPDELGLLVRAMRGGELLTTSADSEHRGGDLYWVRKPTSRVALIADMYVVHASLLRFGRVSGEYGPQDTHVLELVFREVASLTVSVPGAAAHPARSELSLHLLPEGEPDSIATRMRADGRRVTSEGLLDESMRYSWLQPGRYRLLLTYAYTFQTSESPRNIAEEILDVRPGDNNYVLSIPVMHRLKLVPPEGHEPGRYSIQGDDGSSVETTVGRQPVDAGLFRAGRYTVSGERGSLRVQLTSDMDLRLELEPFTALRLSGVGTQGRAWEMGLRDGDLLTAIGGQDPQHADRLRELVNSTAEDDQTTWAVLRDGTSVNVRVRGPAIASLRADGTLVLTPARRD